MNIVFDFGGVVFDWNPEKILNDVFESNEARNLVQAAIAMGIQGIHFSGAAQCRQELMRLCFL